LTFIAIVTVSLVAVVLAAVAFEKRFIEPILIELATQRDGNDDA